MRIRPLRAAIVPVLAFLVVAGPPATASAAPLTVCVTGCSATTIQDAVDLADPGDEITVAAGTYAEALVVDVEVTIRGARAGVDARNRSSDSGDTVIAPGNALAVEAMEALVLDGVVVDGGTASAIETDSDLTIRNSIVRGGSATTADTVDLSGPGALAITHSRVARSGSGSTVRARSGVTAVSVTDSLLTSPSTGTTYGIEVSAAGTTTLAVLRNAFVDFDRALTLAGTFAATPTFRLNRIDRQSSSSDGVYSTSPTAVDATDNLWGCGAALPAPTGTCDVLGGSGPANVQPYLVLAVVPAVLPVPPAPAATTVAARLQRQDGTTPPEGLASFEGIAVAFSSGTSSSAATTTFGAIAPVEATLAAGAAATSFTPPDDGGETNLRARVDGANYMTKVDVRARAAVATNSARITGEPRFGSLLTCITEWSRGTGVDTTQWLRKGVAIPGAGTGPATYLITAADIGKPLSCQQTRTIANADPATSAVSPAIKVGKRKVVLTILQSNANGVGMTCGTTRKPCVLRRPAKLFVKVSDHATRYKGMKVRIVLERKSGRRWIAVKPTTQVVGAKKPLAVPTAALAAGSWRVRVQHAAGKLDELASSPYRFLTIR